MHINRFIYIYRGRETNLPTPSSINSFLLNNPLDIESRVNVKNEKTSENFKEFAHLNFYNLPSNIKPPSPKISYQKLLCPNSSDISRITQNFSTLPPKNSGLNIVPTQNSCFNNGTSNNIHHNWVNSIDMTNFKPISHDLEEQIMLSPDLLISEGMYANNIFTFIPQIWENLNGANTFDMINSVESNGSLSNLEPNQELFKPESLTVGQESNAFYPNAIKTSIRSNILHSNILRHHPYCLPNQNSKYSLSYMPHKTNQGLNDGNPMTNTTFYHHQHKCGRKGIVLNDPPKFNMCNDKTKFGGETSYVDRNNFISENVYLKNKGSRYYPKPPYSYSCLIAMALKNSKTGCLPVNEIYEFMCENFPYFKTAPDGWKNSVRHNLSLNKSFEKIDLKKNTSKKGCLWTLNSKKIMKMNEEIIKWRKKDFNGVRKSMYKPEHLTLIEEGKWRSQMYCGSNVKEFVPSPSLTVLNSNSYAAPPPQPIDNGNHKYDGNSYCLNAFNYPYHSLPPSQNIYNYDNERPDLPDSTVQETGQTVIEGLQALENEFSNSLLPPLETSDHPMQQRPYKF